MKAHVLLLAAGLLPLSKVAAQVPNGGFENWTTVGTYQDPTDWITFNALTSVGGVDPSCEQGSPGAVGSHYAQVTTRSSGILGVLPGIISVGNATTGSTGFAYSTRPGALTGQWQYSESGDSALVAVQLTKWNTATQSADIIGTGALQVSGTVSTWQPLNVPIFYVSPLSPDTAYILIASSISTPVAGSFVKVDDLGFGAASGIEESTADLGLQVYPSPTTDVLRVSAAKPIVEVAMMDMTGRTILRETVNAPNHTFNVSDLQAGRYLVQVRMEGGKRLVRSFVKQ